MPPMRRLTYEPQTVIAFVIFQRKSIVAKLVEGRNGGKILRPDKGESMNPKGKPKGVLNSKTRLLRLLELVKVQDNPLDPSLKSEKFSQIELMDAAMILKAQAGDVLAYREILDRLEGKVTQKSEMTGPDGKDLFPQFANQPIQVEILKTVE